jgi:hypothetical protein
MLASRPANWGERVARAARWNRKEHHRLQAGSHKCRRLRPHRHGTRLIWAAVLSLPTCASGALPRGHVIPAVTTRQKCRHEAHRGLIGDLVSTASRCPNEL